MSPLTALGQAARGATVRAESPWGAAHSRAAAPPARWRASNRPLACANAKRGTLPSLSFSAADGRQAVLALWFAALAWVSLHGGQPASAFAQSGVGNNPKKTLVINFTPGQRQVSLAGVVLMRRGRGLGGIADELNRIYGPPSECAGAGSRWTATWRKWKFAVEYVDTRADAQCAGAGRFGGFSNTRKFLEDFAKGWVARTSLGTMRVSMKLDALPPALRRAGQPWSSETGDTIGIFWRLGPGRKCLTPEGNPYWAGPTLQVNRYVDNPPRVYGFDVSTGSSRC